MTGTVGATREEIAKLMVITIADYLDQMVTINAWRVRSTPPVGLLASVFQHERALLPSSLCFARAHTHTRIYPRLSADPSPTAFCTSIFQHCFALAQDHHQELSPLKLFPGHGKPAVALYWLSAMCHGVRDDLQVIPPIFDHCTKVLTWEDEVAARDL